jgi:hypothetical protein
LLSRLLQQHLSRLQLYGKAIQHLKERGMIRLKRFSGLAFGSGMLLASGAIGSASAAAEPQIANNSGKPQSALVIAPGQSADFGFEWSCYSLAG